MKHLDYAVLDLSRDDCSVIFDNFLALKHIASERSIIFNFL